MKNNNKTYKRPKLSEYINWICNEFGLDYGEVATALVKRFPELINKERCSNCGSSMVEYIYHIDSLNALLVYGMGKIVMNRVKDGKTLDEANRVHIQTELNSYYSVPSRSSQCAYLGLIEKVRTDDGTHDQKAGWKITEKGFRFLAQEPVGESVRVWDKKVVEEYDVTITIHQAWLNKGKKIREYDGEIRGFKPEEWSYKTFERARHKQQSIFNK